MYVGKKFTSYDQARKLDILSYLCASGYEPSKIGNHDYWYLSPLREENFIRIWVLQKKNGTVPNLVTFSLRFFNMVW